MIGNPNALPGTVLNSQPGALETARQVIPLRLQAVQQAAARDAAKAKADADAAKALLGKDIPIVAPWDVPEFTGMVNSWKDEAANALKAWKSNPMNSDLDPTNPTSSVSRQLADKYDALMQYSAVSNDNQKNYNSYALAFDPTKDAPEDLKSFGEYYRSPASKHMSGQVGQPLAIGNYSAEEAYNAQLDKLKPDQTAWANPGKGDKTGYLVEGTNQVLSEGAVKEMAFNMGKPAPGNRHAEYMARQLRAMPAERREKIEKEAAENGVSPTEWASWQDVRDKGYVKQTANLSADPSYGAGGSKTQELGAKHYVDIQDGLYNGDMSLFDEVKNLPSFINPAFLRGDKVYRSEALADYTFEEEQVTVMGKDYKVKYKPEYISKNATTGDYRIVLVPDVSGVDKTQVTKLFPPKIETVSQEKIGDYMFPKGPLNGITEAQQSKYLPTIGGTHEDTGHVRFKEKTSNSGGGLDAITKKYSNTQGAMD